MSGFVFHPVTTFFAGLIVAVVALGLLVGGCAPPNRSAQAVQAYRDGMAKANAAPPAPGSAAEKAALDRFETFLKGVGSEEFIRANTSKTYSADAYLNDTLVTRHGAAAIEAYFIKTSHAMKTYQVTIDEVARTGANYYVRWTMVVSAPALSHGEPIESTGISQVRFDSEGKVAFHQDFWDSGENFFGKLPVAGGVIGFIRKKLE